MAYQDQEFRDRLLTLGFDGDAIKPGVCAMSVVVLLFCSPWMPGGGCVLVLEQVLRSCWKMHGSGELRLWVYLLDRL